MSIPINGRIAILDDKIEQARPIIEELSKRQCPITYFSGEPNQLPKEGSLNDIRILFLDINLYGDEARTDKEKISFLVPRLQRVISESNFPYLLIYWSRHEEEHKELVQNIFENDLSDRKPIGFLSLNKSEFFTDAGEKKDGYSKKVSKIFSDIEKLIKEKPVYDYLLEWENLVHTSTDKGVEEIFNKTEDISLWENDCNLLFNKLGVSYSGKTYSKMGALEQIKSTFYALNIVLSDDLDHNTLRFDHKDPVKLNSKDDPKIDIVPIVNRKLLTTKEIDPITYPGTIILDNLESRREEYSVILDDTLSKKSKKETIEESLQPVLVVVTPLCDFVQEKVGYNRVVRGFLVNQMKRDYFHKNEATYVSPAFEVGDESKMLILHYSQFHGLKKLDDKNLKPIARIRQQMLGEIQSQLSRHINRQGVLYLY